MDQHQASQLSATPQDDLQALLAPLQSLTDAELDTLPSPGPDPELLGNDQLLEFRLDGTPEWWPLNRDLNGKNWSLAERRRVLLRRVQETQPGVSPSQASTPTGKRQLVQTLRHIAYALRSRASDILSSS